MNEITFKDANLFSLINEFLKEFIRYITALLIGFFFKYNQLRLVLKNKDITAFQTLLRLLRMINIL